MKTLPVRFLPIFPNHQFTIPSDFYETLSFSCRAECILRGRELVFLPLRSSVRPQHCRVLSALLAKGYGGSRLVEEFRKAQGLTCRPKTPPPDTEIYVEDLSPLPNHRLLIQFINRELRLYDCDMLLRQERNHVLRELSLFVQVRITPKGIIWPNGLYLSNRFLYENSVPTRHPTRGRTG